MLLLGIACGLTGNYKYGITCITGMNYVRNVTIFFYSLYAEKLFSFEHMRSALTVRIWYVVSYTLIFIAT